MGVIFKGGNSGSRSADYSPPVPSGGSSQPVQDTSTSGPVASSVRLQAETFRPNLPQTATPDFMPTGGGEAHGTDLQDPTATTGGDQGVFKGTDE